MLRARVQAYPFRHGSTSPDRPRTPPAPNRLAAAPEWRIIRTPCRRTQPLSVPSIRGGGQRPPPRMEILSYFPTSTMWQIADFWRSCLGPSYSGAACQRWASSTLGNSRMVSPFGCQVPSRVAAGGPVASSLPPYFATIGPTTCWYSRNVAGSVISVSTTTYAGISFSLLGALALLTEPGIPGVGSRPTPGMENVPSILRQPPDLVQHVVYQLRPEQRLQRRLRDRLGNQPLVAEELVTVGHRVAVRQPVGIEVRRRHGGHRGDVEPAPAGDHFVDQDAGRVRARQGARRQVLAHRAQVRAHEAPRHGPVVVQPIGEAQRGDREVGVDVPQAEHSHGAALLQRAGQERLGNHRRVDAAV